MGRHPRPSIEEHGVVGDLRTVALVDTAGTVDFLCWPRVDAPTVFAALLDPERGGHFALAPALGDAARGEDARRRQLYLPDTNVLLTRFLSVDAVAEVTDVMPVGTPEGGGPQRLVRVARCVRGEARFEMRCAPRFDYARQPHRAEARAGDPGGAHAVWFRPDARTSEGGAPASGTPASGTPASGGAMRLLATVPLAVEGGDATAAFTLRQGETATFVFDAPAASEDAAPGDADAPPGGLAAYGARCVDETAAFWRAWIGKASYRGRYREIVHRSALALKLLTSAEHGAIVAAPTFGLPEVLGGSRNWDYRYTWIRDAAFTVYAFIRLGFTAEADGFMRWVYARATDGPHDGTLQIMYGLDGRQTLPETELPHLAGYANSRPVRVGNAAFDQLQLDSYGALLDAVYLANKYTTPLAYDGWRAVVRTVDWVCDNWRREDEGIWEFRGGRRHFLSSRLMCWVAVDRALRMAQKFSLPGPYARWLDARNAIHQSVYDDFWDAEQGAFVQAKGSAALDASCLLMPLVKFVSPTDPRWLSTLDAVGRRLASGPVVRRYDPGASAAVDGLEGVEGSFSVCSFWYVECLARAGRVDAARLLFDELLGYANHVGLYAEELGPVGDHLGNFPQALTHLALISAAYALDRALDKGGGRG